MTTGPRLGNRQKWKSSDVSELAFEGSFTQGALEGPREKAEQCSQHAGDFGEAGPGSGAWRHQRAAPQEEGGTKNNPAA